MRDWLGFASTDLVFWEPCGPLLRVDEFTWARDGAKGSKVIECDGRFFWYVAVNHGSIDGGAIGVAVADHPMGPFQDAIGAALVTNDVPFGTGDDHTIYPNVTVHDGEAYLYWGKERCFWARLDKSMTSLPGPISEIDLPYFKEGVHVHERDGLFYLSYGYQYPQRVAYAMSRSPEGPWRFEGLVNEVPGNCATNRPTIIEFDRSWYFFYHNGVLPGGDSYHRFRLCRPAHLRRRRADEQSADDDRRSARVAPKPASLARGRPEPVCATSKIGQARDEPQHGRGQLPIDAPNLPAPVHSRCQPTPNCPIREKWAGRRVR